MDAKVLEVVSVSFVLTKSSPPGIVIHATGRVPSSGWSNGRLSPYVYLHPPADGIWDFDFIATAPSGIALTVMSPIDAVQAIHPSPAWCKGVRIHAGSNTMESKNADLDESKLSVLNWVPYPWATNASTILNTKGAVTQGGVDGFPWSANP